MRGDQMQTIITYNEHEATESNDLLKSLEIGGNKVWIDLIDPSADVLENLRTTLNLDSKAVEQYINKNKKPQIRVLESHTFIIILDVKYKSSQTILTEGIYLFCGKNWLISIHSAEVDLVKNIKKLWEEENKKILKDSIEALNYSILSEIVDRYEQALTAIELKITDLEENSLNESNRDTLESLDILSRQLIVFRRHFWLVRDVFNFLVHTEEDKDEIKYVRMAYDNITQLIELVESYRDTINSARDLYIANISLQMNDTMRILTIFATILLPLTLVVGIYGMNGVDLDNLGQLPSGITTVLITMTAITAGLLYFFNRKKWIVATSKHNKKKKPKK